MANRAGDWLKQAERDLEQAQDSRRAGRHEWACFAAQQGAEQAVKALHLRAGQEAWGLVVAVLLSELPPNHRPSNDLIEKGRVLDTFIVYTRREWDALDRESRFYRTLASETAWVFPGGISPGP